MIQTKKLLTNIGTTQYTLTVTTNPSSATCTLTYNGESYNSKTAIVPSGTEISYSIYHSTYGTTTGSITMDSDKTLTCNGTYSTSETDGDYYNSPSNLSANGTLGGSSFAVSASYEHGSAYAAWKAFDGNTSTMWTTGKAKSYSTYMIMYCPTAIRADQIKMGNRIDVSYHTTAGSVYGSNSNGNWTFLSSFTNSDATKKGTWTKPISGNTNYFKYYKIEITDSTFTSQYTPGACEMGIMGYLKTTAYNYYWDKTIA